MYWEMLYVELLQSEMMGRPGGTSKGMVHELGSLWILGSK